jgi:hypothetical protein
MPKITDLGINAIPATMRPPEIGLGTIGTPPKEPPPQCVPHSPPPPPKPGGPKPSAYFSADEVALLRRQLDEAP